MLDRKENKNQSFIRNSTILDTERANDEIIRVEALHQALQYNEPAYHLFVIIWSDACDTNTCKTGRGSTWCQSITFVPHNCPLERSTFLYALSDVKNDHTSSQQDLINSINNYSLGINNLSHHGQRPVRIYLSFFAYLADQPERRKYLNLMMGNSTYHARWGLNFKHETPK